MVCSASRSPRVDIDYSRVVPGGGCGRLADHGDEVAGLNDVAHRHADLADGAVDFGEDRDLHLHRLQQHHDVALADLVAFVHNDFEHAGHDFGANILGHSHPTHFGHRRRLAVKLMYIEPQ